MPNITMLSVNIFLLLFFFNGKTFNTTLLPTKRKNIFLELLTKILVTNRQLWTKNYPWQQRYITIFKIYHQNFFLKRNFYLLSFIFWYLLINGGILLDNINQLYIPLLYVLPWFSYINDEKVLLRKMRCIEDLWTTLS